MKKLLLSLLTTLVLSLSTMHAALPTLADATKASKALATSVENLKDYSAPGANAGLKNEAIKEVETKLKQFFKTAAQADHVLEEAIRNAAPTIVDSRDRCTRWKDNAIGTVKAICNSTANIFEWGHTAEITILNTLFTGGKDAIGVNRFLTDDQATKLIAGIIILQSLLLVATFPCAPGNIAFTSYTMGTIPTVIVSVLNILSSVWVIQKLVTFMTDHPYLALCIGLPLITIVGLMYSAQSFMKMPKGVADICNQIPSWIKVPAQNLGKKFDFVFEQIGIHTRVGGLNDMETFIQELPQTMSYWNTCKKDSACLSAVKELCKTPGTCF